MRNDPQFRFFTKWLYNSLDLGRRKYEYYLSCKDQIPLWMFDAYNANTCALCRMLNYRVYRWDHPFWSTYYPPLHFRCTCKVLAVTSSAMSIIGKAIICTDMPPIKGKYGKILLPQKGFGFPHSKVQIAETVRMLRDNNFKQSNI